MSKLIERLRAATCNSMHLEMSEAADCIARLTDEVSRLRANVSTARGWLQYYADGSHFIQHDPTAWDTVSGEPENFQEDEAATATVEDGSMAKLALMQMDGFVQGIPMPGEFHSLYAAYQAQQHAGVLASGLALPSQNNRVSETGAKQELNFASTEPFQTRVHSWMMECFGEAISADKQERNHRFLEEALELVQACGATQSEAYQLVGYVYGRPVGEPSQEVGGVAVTLAALCSAQQIDMHQAGETELARIWTKVEKIRAKQAAKPKHSPLPAAASLGVQNDAGSELLDALENSISALSFMLDHEMRGENRPKWVRIKRDRLDAARAAISKATEKARPTHG